MRGGAPAIGTGLFDLSPRISDSSFSLSIIDLDRRDTGGNDRETRPFTTWPGSSAVRRMFSRGSPPRDEVDERLPPHLPRRESLARTRRRRRRHPATRAFRKSGPLLARRPRRRSSSRPLFPRRRDTTAPSGLSLCRAFRIPAVAVSPRESAFVLVCVLLARCASRVTTTSTTTTAKTTALSVVARSTA